MSKLLIFNKPYMVLSQFTDSENRETLKTYIDTTNVYPAGRLDRDSEGLLLLTDDGDLQNRISHPKHKLPKTYWVQVEGEITNKALDKLRRGVQLKDGVTKPAKALCIEEPNTLWPRSTPIRERKNIPTSWLELTITEGKNRQVRRMTAAVGFPTLRLIRYKIGPWTLENIAPGELKEVGDEELSSWLDSLPKVKKITRENNGRKNASFKNEKRRHSFKQKSKKGSNKR